MRTHISLIMVLIMLLSSPTMAEFSESGTGDQTMPGVEEVRTLADQGSAPHQFKLGAMYASGFGVPQDYLDAARWYRMAADQGYDRAQNNLGVLYEDGHGVPRDFKEALKWYRKAAEQGLSYAQFNLAEMYFYGRGVEPNIEEARIWYRKAASQGYRKAAAALERESLREKTQIPRQPFGDGGNKSGAPNEIILEMCIKQVQRELPYDKFDAYMENSTVRMFGTPETFFKFRNAWQRVDSPSKRNRKQP